MTPRQLAKETDKDEREFSGADYRGIELLQTIARNNDIRELQDIDWNILKYKYSKFNISNINLVKFEVSIVEFLNSMSEGLQGQDGVEIFAQIDKIIDKDVMIANL